MTARNQRPEPTWHVETCIVAPDTLAGSPAPMWAYCAEGMNSQTPTGGHPQTHARWPGWTSQGMAHPQWSHQRQTFQSTVDPAEGQKPESGLHALVQRHQLHDATRMELPSRGGWPWPRSPSCVASPSWVRQAHHSTVVQQGFHMAPAVFMTSMEPAFARQREESPY